MALSWGLGPLGRGYDCRVSTVVAGLREGELPERLSEALSTGARDIVVRLASFDATAATLTFLRDVTCLLRASGGRLVVVTDDVPLRRLLRLTLLDQTLEVRDTEPV